MLCYVFCQKLDLAALNEEKITKTNEFVVIEKALLCSFLQYGVRAKTEVGGIDWPKERDRVG